MIFNSKVDKWIYAVITLEFVVVVASTIMMLYMKGVGGLTGIVAPALLGLGIPLWLLYSIRYEVTVDKLIVHAAWKKWEIPKIAIKSIKPSRSMLSSPALSLDRLEIRYGNDDTLMVSPQDKQGFLKALGATLQQG